MKNTIILVLIGICAIAFTSGCASTQQFVALPNQKLSVENMEMGRIYVLRPEVMLGGAARMKVRDGERLIGDLGTNSFLCWERVPGKTTVFLDFYSIDDYVIIMPEDLDVEGGKVYYLRAGLLSMNPISNDTNKLDRLWRLDNAEGERLLKGCNPPPLATPESK